MNPPEFSRPILVGAIGPDMRVETVTATPSECAALAKRLGVPAVLSLSCAFALHRAPGNAVIAAEAELDATVVQTCVLSLDEFEASITEAFALRFVPAGTESESLDLDAPDDVPYTDGRIDLGEAAAEQLALLLDPFPRKPGATLPETTAETSSPFTALRSLRRH